MLTNLRLQVPQIGQRVADLAHLHNWTGTSPSVRATTTIVAAVKTIVVTVVPHRHTHHYMGVHTRAKPNECLKAVAVGGPRWGTIDESPRDDTDVGRPRVELTLFHA